MESPKNLWVWGFLLLGLAFIAFAFFFGPSSSSTSKKPTVVLARVEKQTGSGWILRNNLMQKEILGSRSEMGPLDSIETGDLGEVRLDFESGFRVRLKEQSLATLERVEDQKGFHVVLILKRGNLQIETFGREGELFIAKNGERISAVDYSESPLAQVPVQEPEAGTTPSNTNNPSSSLSEQEIQTVMNSHRTSFLKCYTQLLQKDPHAKGDVSLNFTVENSGKISALEVTSTSLSQSDFKKCLMDVMGRIEFQAFPGAPVSTLFPLKFE